MDGEFETMLSDECICEQGCVVQVTVKNGKIYEGILRTTSPKVCDISCNICCSCQVDLSVEYLCYLNSKQLSML